MMYSIPKWKVTVVFPDREIVFWMYDTHQANIFRKVADMQFTEHGLEQPLSVSVTGTGTRELTNTAVTQTP